MKLSIAAERIFTLRAFALILCACVLLAWTNDANASASFNATQPMLGDDDEESDEKDDDEAAEEEEDKDEYLAVVGGDVYTGTGAVLRGTSILSKNGIIKEIGTDLYIPEDAEIIDATGMRVYPGLVALSATGSIVRGVVGAVEDPHPIDEHVHGPGGVELQQKVGREALEKLAGILVDRAKDIDLADSTSFGHELEDAYDPFGQNLVLALAAGITTTQQSGMVVKLKRNEIEGVVMGPAAVVNLSWSSPAGKRNLREKFAAASAYLRDYAQWEIDVKRDDKLKEPSNKGVDSNILGVLQNRVRAQFNSSDRSDLLGLARFAQEYNFRPILRGAIEGWTVAGELGRAGAMAILTPRDRRGRSEELVRSGGSSIENPAVLHDHGVQVAVVPSDTSVNLQGITGRDILHLTVEAAFAVRGGMSNEAALQAITLIPARMLGMGHRIGSLELGKDADMIVTDGDLLHYQTLVQYTVVEGKLVYDKQEELFYAHIRPRPEAQPEEILDPGEAAPEAVASEEGDDDGADEEDEAEGEDEEDAEE